MKVAFIINGSKKNGRKIPSKVKAFSLTGFEFQFHFTKKKGDGISLAENLAKNADIIVSAGGDGTLNECVNGLMRFYQKNDLAELPSLALFTLGSGNDFARNFNWKKSFDDLMIRLQKNSIQTIDVGWTEHANDEKQFFINETSTGLSTEVVKRVNSMPTYLNGNIKFGISIIRAFFTFRKQMVKVSCDEFQWKGKAMLVVCANGKYFGSGIGIAPDALIDDGILDITIIGDVTLLDYLKYLPKLRRCQKINHREVHYFRTRSLNLEGDGMMEKDGEMSSTVNCAIRIIPGALKMI